MDVAGLASRVLRRTVVIDWLEGYGRHEPEDLLNDALEGHDGSLEAFRSAVARRRYPPAHLGKSDKHLVWCSPGRDVQAVRDSGASKDELISKLGMSAMSDDAIEILYPASAVSLFYKPCAVHAGANPLFSPAPVDSEFGRTKGGMREAVHLPLAVVDALADGAHLRLWRT